MSSGAETADAPSSPVNAQEIDVGDISPSLSRNNAAARAEDTTHRLPNHPKCIDYLTLWPRQVYGFFQRLTHAFGGRYVALLALTYGVNQGIGSGFGAYADKFIKSDAPPVGLGLSPAKFGAISGFTNVPWQIKALYGIFSDTLPIGGQHQTPYFVFAAALGTAAWLCLGVLPLNLYSYCLFLLLANYSMASPDVMIDASVAQRSRTHPHLASDMQVLCWCSVGLGLALSSSLAGFVYSGIGSRGLFLLCIGTAVAILVPGMCGWLSERRETPVRALTDCAPLKRGFTQPRTWPLFLLAVLLCGISFFMGILATAVDNELVVASIGLAVGVLVVALVLVLESKVSVDLAKASAYIFLAGAVQPTTEVVFYWLKETPDNCSGEYGVRPCFEPEFIGLMTTIGYLCFSLGTVLYNCLMSKWSYRRIWTTTHVLLVVVNLLDLVWVERWNLALGIPDKAFILGEEVLSPMVARWNMMPMLVLAAKLCPKGTEATVFALNMGLSNFGVTMGSYLGIGLLGMLGGVEAPEFHNLSLLVIIRSLTRFIPILLIPFLVPLGSPADLDVPEDPDPDEMSVPLTEMTHSERRDTDISDGDADNLRHTLSTQFDRERQSGDEDEGEEQLQTSDSGGVHRVRMNPPDHSTDEDVDG